MERTWHPSQAWLEVDFVERQLAIGGQHEREYLFVAILSFSPRLYVKAFGDDSQASWFDGLQRARSSTLAAPRGRCCSSIPDHSSGAIKTRYAPTSGFGPSRRTGASCLVLGRLTIVSITRAGSTLSKKPRLPGVPSRAGRSSKVFWISGYAKSPIVNYTLMASRHRSSASSEWKHQPYRPSMVDLLSPAVPTRET